MIFDKLRPKIAEKKSFIEQRKYEIKKEINISTDDLKGCVAKLDLKIATLLDELNNLEIDPKGYLITKILGKFNKLNNDLRTLLLCGDPPDDMKLNGRYTERQNIFDYCEKNREECELLIRELEEIIK